MGVDGIGRGGGNPVGSVGQGEPAAAPGALEAAQETRGAEGAERSLASAALQKLERGEINLDGYLDARVLDAVKHLEGRLPTPQLDFIKQALRSELSTDPVLVELVRRTTGSAAASGAE